MLHDGPGCPTVVLHVHNLDAARAEREIDHGADPLDVGPVHHRFAPWLLSQLQEPFVGQAAQERADVRQNFLARRCVALRQLIDQLGESDLAGAALDDLGRDCIGLEHPFGRKQNPAALGFVVDEPHPARQSRPRLGGDQRARIAQTVLQSCGTKAPGGTCLGAT